MSDGSTNSLYDKKKNRLSKSLVQIKKWAQNYSHEMVNRALDQNMKEIIRQKTHDDCSIIMFVKIEKSHHQMRHLDNLFLMELLNAKNQLSLKNRMKILYQISNNKIHNTQLVAKKTSLSASTVRSHKNVLKSLTNNQMI